MPHAAAEAADELRCEAQQHRGQFAAGHQLRRKDEERHGLQCEEVDAGEQVLRQRDEWHVAGRHRHECRAAERECDRHAEREQRDATDEQDRHHARCA